MKRRIFLFCIVAIFSVVTFYLFSEVFVLRNGDVIRGKLIKMDEDTMTILAKYGELVIDRDDIEEIYKDEASYKNKQTKSKINSSDKNDDNMIFVKGGTFIMGDTFGYGKSDEVPVHNVTVNAFYISKHEVTFEEFDKYCIDNDLKKRTKRDEKDFMYLGDKDFKRPVWEISWYEAIDYCNWLSEKKGLTPCYIIDKSSKDPNNKNSRDKLKWKVECNFNANGYRLPTEAEWEYAARGGNKSKNYKFSGENEHEKVAQYGRTIGPKGMYTTTLAVGSKIPNELGIYDMSGNVWEWCWDWYDKDYYNNSPQENPQGPESGKSRVLRGGSFSSNISLLCVSTRKEAVQNDLCDDWRIRKTVGFRIVRSTK